jgi:hypothetical protein
MINCLIFTKNRACQLDLLLRSIDENFLPRLDIHILAKTTEEEYKEGYEFLQSKHKFKNFYWEQADNFQDQVMAIVNSFSHDWTLCFLDDDVVLHLTTVEPYLEYITEGVNALSLRMGLNILDCYPKNVVMAQPLMEFPQNNIMKWRWIDYDRSLDWGYPMSLGGNIYRTDYIKDAWSNISFTSPNWIEGYMAISPPQNRPYQISFTEQKVLNVANNLVQDVCDNKYDAKAINDVRVLNQRFQEGYVIDLKTLSSKTYNSANSPAEYKLVKN